MIPSCDVCAATVEVDFTATSQLLVFNAATSEHTVMIPIIDDDLLEHVESFSATLTLLASDDQVSLSPSEATITILDNDGKKHFFLQGTVFLNTAQCTGLCILDSLLYLNIAWNTAQCTGLCILDSLLYLNIAWMAC